LSAAAASSLASMANIGEALEAKLKAVGINTAEELRKAGSKNAFLSLKLRYPNVCLVHLQALEGAVLGIPHNQLPEETKLDLKDFSDGLK